MEGFYQTYYEVIQSIENSINERKIITSLILMYSAIDSFSNLSNLSNKPGREVFKKWVDNWMLKEKDLKCNSTDIYAARCGILHSFISESNLSKKEKAKKICYAWGNSDLLKLESKINETGKSNEYVALKLEDLFQAFRLGIANCIEEIEKNSDWKKVFESRAKKYFIQINSL